MLVKQPDRNPTEVLENCTTHHRGFPDPLGAKEESELKMHFGVILL